ncbi:DNA recombinase [Escherichia coli]
MFRGAYVDYLMKDGRHLVFFIDLQDLAQSRAKSESWAKVEKRQYSPWTQFPWKMVLKSAIKQTIHLIPGNRTRLSSMIEYLNTAGGEGFRTATIPVAAAEAEMEVRQEARTAGNTDTTIRTAKSDDKVIEGEFNKLPEEPDSTEQQDIKSNTPTDVYDTAEGNTPPADVNGSADDILPPPGETNGQSNEEMSEHPGVRKWAERRIKKLVSRAEKTLGYETILNDAKSSFDLNESELAFARLSLEKSRRSLLKNHLTNAVGSFDFTQVLNFIEKMGKGEFKTDAAKWVGEVQAESMEIHKLYLEAVNTSDFVRLNAALNNVTFPPLKEMVEGLIEDLLAA